MRKIGEKSSKMKITDQVRGDSRNSACGILRCHRAATRPQQIGGPRPRRARERKESACGFGPQETPRAAGGASAPVT